MNTLAENGPMRHELYDLLKNFFGFTYPRLRWELRQRGHAVSASRLSLMLRGFEQVPPDLEVSLRHMAAEHIEDRPLCPEEVREVLAAWFNGSEDDEDFDERRPAIDHFTDFIDALDDPQRIAELACGISG